MPNERELIEASVAVEYMWGGNYTTGTDGIVWRIRPGSSPENLQFERLEICLDLPFPKQLIFVRATYVQFGKGGASLFYKDAAAWTQDLEIFNP
jgi:hypothetical protein